MYDHMRVLIPEDHQAEWARALADGDCVYKLCGSGGGGYLLRRNKPDGLY